MRKFIIFIIFLIPTFVCAQIGEHRNRLSVGVNGGYNLSNVGFTPKVTQSMHGGVVGGISVKYVSEKYFKTLCSIYAEINYAQMGWKENIVDIDEQPVVNASTGLPEAYERTLNYIQLPVFAHLAWGKEEKGTQFFVQLGPQIGFLLSESTKMNFPLTSPNLDERANKEATQYVMDVENKFDYGIAAGLGMEFLLPHVGSFVLDGRYYYGLGNIYGDSKRDYFSKSNNNTFTIKLTYLFDLKNKNK